MKKFPYFFSTATPTIRTLLLAVAAALSYCFVVTTFFFYYLRLDYHRLCDDASICNRTWIPKNLFENGNGTDKGKISFEMEEADFDFVNESVGLRNATEIENSPEIESTSEIENSSKIEKSSKIETFSKTAKIEKSSKIESSPRTEKSPKLEQSTTTESSPKFERSTTENYSDPENSSSTTENSSKPENSPSLKFEYFETENFSSKTFTSVTAENSAPKTEKSLSKNETEIPKIELGNFTIDNFDSTNSSNLTLCPIIPPFFVGPLKMDMIHDSVREHEIITKYPELSLGGHWKPPDCRSRHKLAVIIPYRDRKSHLDRLINFLIPILKKHLVDFRFIVAEQYGDGLFNKGRVMNAAFQFAEKFGVECVIFHDVDMFPEDDRIPYTCPDQPRHLGAYVNVLKYDLWYNYLLGGVVAIRMEHYKRVNGHSNMFWGYGGEDDDFGRRVLANNMTIERPPKSFSKYAMLKHKKRKYAVKENIHHLLNNTETRWPYDGLNDTQWSIVSLMPKPLYYHLYVNVGEIPKDWQSIHRKAR